MKYNELRLMSLINRLRLMDVNAFIEPNKPFLYIFPKKNKTLALDTTYKPNDNELGMDSQYIADLNANEEIISKAREHLQESDYIGTEYSFDHASLKMHISINNIANLDHEIIYDLIQLLVDEMNNVSNNLKFDFKFITPPRSTGPRFNHNDQFTIYFSKYSSAKEFIVFAQKINNFFTQKNIPANGKTLGDKDCISFNSFVSARFSSSRMLKQYNTYPFFDEELKKFFQTVDLARLETVPLCAFEMIFNKVLFSDKITIPHADEANPNLSEEDSKFVQNELERLVLNPLGYLRDPKHDFPTPIKPPPPSQTPSNYNPDYAYRFFNGQPVIVDQDDDASLNDQTDIDFNQLHAFINNSNLI